MAVAQKVKRSSRTAKNQVDSHNLAIQRSGFCPACKRVASEHYNKVVLKG